MIYPYECNTCSATTEFIRPVSMHTHIESCQCGSDMRQVYSLARPIVDNMESEYYPSLGAVVKSKRHRREIMKRQGLIEVGNESHATVHAEMTKQRESRRRKYEV